MRSKMAAHHIPHAASFRGNAKSLRSVTVFGGRYRTGVFATLVKVCE